MKKTIGFVFGLCLLIAPGAQAQWPWPGLTPEGYCMAIADVAVQECLRRVGGAGYNEEAIACADLYYKKYDECMRKIRGPYRPPSRRNVKLEDLEEGVGVVEESSAN